MNSIIIYDPILRSVTVMTRRTAADALRIGLLALDNKPFAQEG